VKTNRSSRMARNVVLALAGAFIFAGTVNAQGPACQGKFTLPFELHLDELGDFFYSAPKAEGLQMASAPQLIQRIPVFANGKQQAIV